MIQPTNFIVGKFVHMIHKRINVGAEKEIFIFVNNVLPPTGKLNLINFNLMFNFAANIVWHFLFQYLTQLYFNNDGIDTNMHISSVFQ